MDRINDFTISGYTFCDARDSDIGQASSANWNEMQGVAFEAWRNTDQVVKCVEDEGHANLAVIDSNGQFVETVGLYRIRPVADDPNTVSCLVAPLFQEMVSGFGPGPMPGPDGYIDNDDDIESIRSTREVFWGKTFAVIEYLLFNPLPLEGGGALTVDYVRFPHASDADPVEHEWVDVQDAFADHCKVEVVWDGGVPLRANAARLTPEPDAGRGFAEFPDAD